MNKAELMKYGIPEEKISAFQRAYWQDLNKRAEALTTQREEERRTSETARIQDAIFAMVRIIPDIDRLRRILEAVNVQYYRMSKEQEIKGAMVQAAPLSPTCQRHFNAPDQMPKEQPQQERSKQEPNDQPEKEVMPGVDENQNIVH